MKLKTIALGVSLLFPSQVNSQELDGSFPDLRNYSAFIDLVIVNNKLFFDFEIDSNDDGASNVIYRYAVTSKIGNRRFYVGKPVGIWLDYNDNGLFDLEEYSDLR